MIKPTLRDIAKAASVAPGTVSAILNNSPRDYSSTEVRERVRKVARDMGYRTNRLAQSLRQQRTHAVALVHKNQMFEILRWQMRGLEARAMKLGYRLVITYDVNLEECVETLLDYRMDGFVWQSDSPESPALLRKLRDTRVPVVTMHGAPVIEGVSGVDCDHEMGMRAAVAHLVGLGHRRIGMAYAGLSAAFTARLKGVRTGLAEHGLSLASSDLHEMQLLPLDEGPDGREDALDKGAALGRRLARIKDRPTAMLMGNDELAMGFIRGFQSEGGSVPKDISVVGFDGIKIGSYWDVPLTTVVQPRQELGAVAMDLLVERIENAGAPARQVILPTEFMARASCGPPPSA